MWGVSKRYPVLLFFLLCRTWTYRPSDSSGCEVKNDVGHLAASFKAQWDRSHSTLETPLRGEVRPLRPRGVKPLSKATERLRGRAGPHTGCQRPCLGSVQHHLGSTRVLCDMSLISSVCGSQGTVLPLSPRHLARQGPQQPRVGPPVPPTE